MPEDDVENFTERSEQRRQLFEDIAARLPATSLSPLLWAIFQVGDLEQLTKVASHEVSWRTVYLDFKSADLELEALNAVRLSKQRREAKDATATPSKRSHSRPSP